MSPDQFAITARAELALRYPYVASIPQADLLAVLAEAFRKATLPASDIPPKLEDVSAFLKTLGSDLNAQDFMDFYAAKAWMIGRVKMKDWRAAARRAHRLWVRPGRSSTRNAFFA